MKRVGKNLSTGPERAFSVLPNGAWREQRLVSRHSGRAGQHRKDAHDKAVQLLHVLAQELLGSLVGVLSPGAAAPVDRVLQAARESTGCIRG